MQAAKAELRKQIRLKIKEIPKQERLNQSKQILDRLKTLPPYMEAKVQLFLHL